MKAISVEQARLIFRLAMAEQRTLTAAEAEAIDSLRQSHPQLKWRAVLSMKGLAKE